MKEASQDVRLAEFAALRQGMAQRAAQEHALIGLNLTALGTIVGFVVTQKAGEELLLVVPLVSSTLGLLWLDHHTNIHRAAAYIRDHLWEWTPSWEKHLVTRHHSRWRAFIFWSSIGLVFAAVPVAALVIGWPPADGRSGVYVLWGLGAALTALYLVAFTHTVFAGVRQRGDPGEASEHRAADPAGRPRSP